MKKWLLAVLICVAGLFGYAGWVLSKPLPMLNPEILLTPTATATPTPSISWSPYGQQALAINGYGLVASHGEQKAAPMASTAKLMLALGVLEKKPLALKQQGPNIPITLADVATYQQYYSAGQSVVAVKAGVALSQYQALQALLLPSANNVATLLANWAFGSTENYLAYANDQAKKLGMNSSSFSDASGFSAATTSTATDLTLLGQAAMAHPVIAEIVNQSTATIPTAGVIKNYNTALGSSGINGIKTGSTDQAGGCFVFSTSFDGLTLVAAIMGAPDRGTALFHAPAVASSFKKSLQRQTVLPSNVAYARYNAPWGASSEVKAQKDVEVVSWVGTTHEVKTQADRIPSASKAGTPVGSASFVYRGKDYQSTLVLKDEIPKPSIWWRLTHPGVR